MTARREMEREPKRVLSRVLGLGIVKSKVVSLGLLRLGSKFRFRSNLLWDWVAKIR